MDGSARAILERLVRIPSATGEEGAVADAVAAICAESGLDVATPEVGHGRRNVVARWKAAAGRRLVLTGHLDTVPAGDGWTRDPHGAEIADGRLYGRGACDMKGGIAAMLGAIVDLRRGGATAAGEVILAAVVGEEEDSAGTRALVAAGIEADMAVLAEPTGMRLVTANRGLRNFRIVVKGASAHASEPSVGRNAIVAAAAIVRELEAIDRELAARPHAVFGAPSLTVGTIHGGTRPYVVPDRCEIEVDRRVNPDENPQDVLDQLDAAVARARREVTWLDAETHEGPDYLAFDIPQDAPLVRAMKGAMTYAGVAPDVSAWRAGSDAGFLVRNAGIPCVLFGPGDIAAAAHRPDEWIDLGDLETAQRVFEALIVGRMPAGEVGDAGVSR